MHFYEKSAQNERKGRCARKKCRRSFCTIGGAFARAEALSTVRDKQKENAAYWQRSLFALRAKLHVALVGLDHLLDHLAADGAGFTAGQVAIVAVLEVDADFL